MLLALEKTDATVPVIFIIIVGILMMLGTVSGGGKIIDTLGNNIVFHTEKIAFVSDFSTTVCIFLCSILGLPVSTGNIKACSLIGAGLGEKQKVNIREVVKIILTSIITFPVCIILGYFFTMLFIRVL
jgi:PiT family inorganic phosphate transporter